MTPKCLLAKASGPKPVPTRVGIGTQGELIDEFHDPEDLGDPRHATWFDSPAAPSSACTRRRLLGNQTALPLVLLQDTANILQFSKSRNSSDILVFSSAPKASV